MLLRDFFCSELLLSKGFIYTSNGPSSEGSDKLARETRERLEARTYHVQSFILCSQCLGSPLFYQPVHHRIGRLNAL